MAGFVDVPQPVVSYFVKNAPAMTKNLLGLGPMSPETPENNFPVLQYNVKTNTLKVVSDAKRLFPSIEFNVTMDKNRGLKATAVVYADLYKSYYTLPKSPESKDGDKIGDEETEEEEQQISEYWARIRNDPDFAKDYVHTTHISPDCTKVTSTSSNGKEIEELRFKTGDINECQQGMAFFKQLFSRLKPPARPKVSPNAAVARRSILDW